MAGRNPFYWNVERLHALFGLIYQLSNPIPNSNKRAIECDKSLAWNLFPRYQNVDPKVTKDQVAYALTLFGKMGVLDEGKRGSKKPGFKRVYNPTVKITQKMVDEARAQMS